MASSGAHLTPATRPFRWGKSVLIILTCCLLFAFTTSVQADRLILRDLTLLRDVTVTGFDEEGVNVTDHGLVPWHQVELGSVGAERQADFDRLRDELGTPLYRIHQRMKVGDYAGLRAPADALFDRYKNRDSLPAYLVCQAVMWGRLATGDREGAVEPYFYCLRYLKQHKEDAAKLPGERHLNHDPQTGLSADLLPLFFNHDRAAATLPQASAAATAVGTSAADGIFVYMSALALAAENYEEADAWRKRIRSGNPTLKQWPQLLTAQQQIQTGSADQARAALTPQIHVLQSINQPVGWYLLGLAGARSENFLDIQNGVLDLLHIPALYGHAHPELAAAALQEASRALTRTREPDRAEEVRRQLHLYYGGTVHASRVEDNTSGTTP